MELSIKDNTETGIFVKMLFYWRSISLRKKLFLLVGNMLALVVFELIILSFAMTNLSAVRSFVGGEGMWSKGQKNAFYQFQLYTITKDPKDYQQIFDSLKILEGDYTARIELLKSKPNLDVVRAAFIQGKMHPDDVEESINFFQNFKNFSYIAKALNNWNHADALFLEFKKIVSDYYADQLSGQLNPAKERKILERVNILNSQLTLIEKGFSEFLGEASRWMEKTIFLVLLAIVFTISAFGITLTYITVRSITGRIKDLNKLTAEYGIGNFEQQLQVDSNDEIGELTHSINKMGSLLSFSYQEILASHQQLEKKVEERTAELKNAINMRDEFLSIANHELRTPLTAIVLQLRILERAVEMAGTQADMTSIRENLKKTNRLVKKLANLQNALMDLTQIQLGKFEIKPESCDLIPTISDCVSQLSYEAGRSGTSINVSLPASVQGNFDPLRSSQVVTNLLSNAIKYGDGKPVDLELKNENGIVVLTVTDHGPGIPEENMHRVFDRFERGDHDNCLSGLGLGLYITRQIVEAHGGQISVKNIEGKGASFQAVFPG